MIEERCSIISYNQLIENLTQFGVTDEHLPPIDSPKVILERDVKVFNSDFNILQLSLLHSMITVDEWEDEPSFYITWKNTDMQSNLKRFVLFYNQKKGVLRKKYVYRNGIEPRKEEKRNVSKDQLISAASKGMSNILADGFKQID
ncbi:hypothetical protein JMM81_08295 [Bacillus sp. V3B]|uniref:hypothetical protein n=1 Tax=Bacillus sp. V3B TaxID=2804915 RepID=UPI00210A241C|nr:hypothetical protein [Bacillus sp. V3B]MCQ6274962.1 hypothetical protein [Bacillus sp. V3B]